MTIIKADKDDLSSSMNLNHFLIIKINNHKKLLTKKEYKYIIYLYEKVQSEKRQYEF